MNQGLETLSCMFPLLIEFLQGSATMLSYDTHSSPNMYAYQISLKYL